MNEQDKQKAAEIVKRCGIRDGLFKGPRTLNAVETIAYELAAERANERERCAEIVESFAADIHMEETDASHIAAAIRES